MAVRLLHRHLQQFRHDAPVVGTGLQRLVQIANTSTGLSTSNELRITRSVASRQLSSSTPASSSAVHTSINRLRLRRRLRRTAQEVVRGQVTAPGPLSALQPPSHTSGGADHPVIRTLQRAIEVRCPGQFVVGQADIRPQENAILNRHAVVDRDTVLDLDVVTDLYAKVNVCPFADDAIAPPASNTTSPVEHQKPGF
jgi:hypothetical protein